MVGSVDDNYLLSHLKINLAKMARVGLGNLFEEESMHKPQRDQMLLRNIKVSYLASTGKFDRNIHCVKYARIEAFSDPLFPV